MRWIIYNVLFHVGYVLLLPKFLWRMCRRGGYARGFMQRFGVYEDSLRRRLQVGGWVWIHAVSVGEIFIALKVAEAWRGRHPDQPLLLSTTTSTGYGVASEHLPAGAELIYFPVDSPWVLRRILRLLQPRMLVLTESELWPNTIRLLRDIGVPVAVMNARISARSYRGYRRIRVFLKDVLRRVNLFVTQSEDDTQRLLALGARSERVLTAASIKYDGAATQRSVPVGLRTYLERTGFFGEGIEVLLGGSTWPGEERVLLEAFRRLQPSRPGLRLVLVPRHAERRGEIGVMLTQAGAAYRRKSDDSVHRTKANDAPVILLADTTGELADLYALATVVFVGKSLLATGGQNFIEPAALAKPVLTGPHLENFPVAAAEFQSARAFVQVQDSETLADGVKAWLEDEGLRREYGARAQALVRSRQGALQQTLEALDALLAPSGEGMHAAGVR